MLAPREAEAAKGACHLELQLPSRPHDGFLRLRNFTMKGLLHLHLEVGHGLDHPAADLVAGALG